ncbi:ubiquitin fusion degradation protein [Gonapodya sp. JEL0774]|nr:ubiquitin fusion degradation protein [Gonapodya sp. JEL0774]
MNADRMTHAGVLEFIAEEGRVYLPNWMMNSLLLEQGDFVQIKNASLPLGNWVKIQPQSVDFLDIHDPRAVLETALRSYSTLTAGDVISLMYNNRPYDIEVLEVKPATDKKSAISIVETDVEVDFAPPVGYQEPKPVKRPPSVMSAAGSHMSIEEHTHERTINQFHSFGGSGNKLNGKPSVPGSVASAESLQVPVPASAAKPKAPAALRLPPGKLYFGYPIVPPKKQSDTNVPSNTSNPSEPTTTAFTGSGQSLRAKKGPRSSPAPTTSPQVAPSLKGKEKVRDPVPVPVSGNDGKENGKDTGASPFSGKGFSLK